ncbi:MAG TPA: hypothetical protein VGC73_09490, partial [Pyrinomonadaceae bacterium]
MRYQPRVRSAIWTTLVLLLAALSANSALAAPKHSDVNRAEDNSTQQNLAAMPTPTPPAGISRGADKQS